VPHHLQIIGEAARSLSADFRCRHDDKLRAKTIGMRNILAHQYFEIEPDIVWNVVEHELPILRAKIVQLLAAES
jgi:uncharacterized protein with HEPN domain